MINAWQFEKYVETALKICLLYEWKIFQVQITSTKHKFTRHTHPTPDNNWTDILLHTQLSCKTYYLVVLNNINYYLSNLIFNFDGVSGRVECVALFARRPPRKKNMCRNTQFLRVYIIMDECPSFRKNVYSIFCQLEMKIKYVCT